jgi:uncharacterized protein with HEPN domain
MPKDPIEILRHINDECGIILSVINEKTGKKDLLENETQKRAVIRSLEIIGEATKMIPADAKNKWQ